MKQERGHVVFGVFDAAGKRIDTVFYSPGDKITAEEVRRSLVNHDGYDSSIYVRCMHRA